MRCDEADALIDALAEDALEASERAQLEGHLGSCARCAAALAASRALTLSLARVPVAALPAGVDVRVRAALAEEQSWARQRARLRRGAATAAAFGAALAASVVVFLAAPLAGAVAESADTVTRVVTSWTRLRALPALDAAQGPLAAIAVTLAALVLLERATSARLTASRR